MVVSPELIHVMADRWMRERGWATKRGPAASSTFSKPVARNTHVRVGAPRLKSRESESKRVPAASSTFSRAAEHRNGENVEKE
jgi:hypothetical protein